VQAAVWIKGLYRKPEEIVRAHISRGQSVQVTVIRRGLVDGTGCEHGGA
jgi:hypothetical protein